MDAQLIAFLILTPVGLVFVYAGIHEFMRYRAEGKATYGLVFDEETGTSHVTGIGDDEDAFDPEDFDPDAFNDTQAESDKT